MIALIVITSMVILLAGYLIYGRILDRIFGVDPNRQTPACEVNDGLDYVPARASLLLGQHFSAISAAGPIVGPILAGLWFGWVPALLWVVIGSILVGGVHDFAALFISLRHQGRSIGEIVKEHMSRPAYYLFLAFLWLALEYVIIAFTDITGQTFKTVAEGTAYGPAVAASSILYILVALLMGVAMHRFKMNLKAVTAVSVPLVLLIIWAGPHLPQPLLDGLAGVSVKQWDVVLLIYCGIASVLPMWLLLQPRGYLGGWLLYLTMAVGLLGALFGGFVIAYPAVNLDGLKSLANGKPMLPILFITVACGACSGFHGIVASGTTSKQVEKETDARRVGLGAMLLEALVAVLALATVMILAPGDAMLKNDPNFVYAHGLARYLGQVGVGMSIALPFALLAFSTFVYDTLDVCTRLARYILQEMFGLKQDRQGAIIATVATLLLPLVFLLNTREKGYLVAWPIFGTTNQLMASLTLLAVVVWLRKSGRRTLFAILPTLFMFGMTMWALFLQVKGFVVSLPGLNHGGEIKPDTLISGVCGIVLLVPAIWLLAEAVRIFISTGKKASEASLISKASDNQAG